MFEFWRELFKFLVAIFVTFGLLAALFWALAYLHCTATSCYWPSRRALMLPHVLNFFVAAVPISFALAWVRYAGSRGAFGALFIGALLAVLLFAAVFGAWPWAYFLR